MRNKIVLCSIVIFLDLLAFFLCPNSILIFLCQLPFNLWQIWTFKKHYVATGILLLIFSFVVFVALPPIGRVVSRLTPLYEFYQAIYPKSFFYRWIDDPPTFVYLSLPISFLTLLVIEVLFWIISRVFRVGHTKNQMLIFSSFFAFISVIYTIFAYLSIIFPFLNIVLEQYILATVVYDILFKWLPFVCFYFVLRYLINRFILGKGG